MNWWQTALISIGASLITAFISFICVNIHNKNGKLKFYISKLYTSEKCFHCMLVVYNPSNIPKLFHNLMLCFYNGKNNIREIQLETSSKDRRNSIGEIQRYDVEPTMINAKEMVKIIVSCSVFDAKTTNKLKLKYKNYSNKVCYYTLIKYKTDMLENLTGGKIDF